MTHDLEHTPQNPEHRLLAAVELRESEVARLSQEIIESPDLLIDAVDAFGNTLSFTGLFECLSYIAQCEQEWQYLEQGAALKEHLHSIAHWQADRLTPHVSIFHKPQAE